MGLVLLPNSTPRLRDAAGKLPMQRYAHSEMEKSKNHGGRGAGFRDGGQLLIHAKIKAGQKPFQGLQLQARAGAVKQTCSEKEGLCPGTVGGVKDAPRHQMNQEPESRFAPGWKKEA